MEILCTLNKEYEELKKNTENEKKENENYKNNLENKIKNFISNISTTKEINLNIEKKCSNILKNETEKIKKQIEESITNSNFLSLVENIKSKEISNAINDFTRESKHINIIIVGKTGVGKSELINSIAGKMIAETGGFRPVQHKGTWHEIGSFRIYDNQGIEISKKKNIDIVINDIKSIIDKAKRSEKPDKFVHCIWYCVTGTRFEEEEELAVGKLKEIYKDNCLPLIIVYLRAVCSEWVKNMQKGIENSFKKGIEFVPVLSKDIVNDDGSIIKAKGLSTLISKTMDKVKNAIDSQSFVYINNCIKTKVENIIINNNNYQINNYNNNNNITDFIIKFFNEAIGGLDNSSKKLISENINILQLKCKNAKFDVEVMDLMKQLLNSINEENECQDNSIKNFLYEKAKYDMEKELKNNFNNNLENYIDKELNSKINDFYKIIIKNVSENIVENNLSKSKSLIVSEIKSSIENNPNFKNIFIMSKES